MYLLLTGPIFPGTKFYDLVPPVKAVELIWVRIPGGATQVSGMFACDYILHADYYGMLSFSVSYMYIKIKILPWMDHPMKQFSTPSMTAANVNMHVCIRFI